MLPAPPTLPQAGGVQVVGVHDTGALDTGSLLTVY
jgi:hypothetical protein